MNKTTENENGGSADQHSFAESCRENTGSHFLDSGGAYGRIYDQPPITHNTPEVTWDDPDCSATIETAKWLENQYVIDQDLTTKFLEWDAEQDDGKLAWADSLHRFFLVDDAPYTLDRGEDYLPVRYQGHGTDNVYNHENDLSQVFTWNVLVPKDCDSAEPGLYADDDTIVVIQIHTGCDVRGGYAAPLLCRCNAEYAVPVDVCAEYGITDCNTLDDKERQAADETWRSGYSSWPYGQVRDDVQRWFPWACAEVNSQIALLKSGHIVKITTGIPYLGE